MFAVMQITRIRSSHHSPLSKLAWYVCVINAGFGMEVKNYMPFNRSVYNEEI